MPEALSASSRCAMALIMFFAYLGIFFLVVNALQWCERRLNAGVLKSSATYNGVRDLAAVLLIAICLASFTLLTTISQ
ncbi:hypothetical protein BJP62_04370 [Jeongeupia sp. USM3]|nr:hypothetical protein BJP62_04370 [Jeongeupia sp. USM3]